MSKLDQVIEIVKSFNGTKKELVSTIQKELNITRANASVYLYKATKVVSIPVNTPVIKEPVIEVTKEPRTLTPNQLEEYTQAMIERESNGFSTMSADDYFDMIENLEGVL